jgi:hypothetical protein
LAGRLLPLGSAAVLPHQRALIDHVGLGRSGAAELVGPGQLCHQCIEQNKCLAGGEQCARRLVVQVWKGCFGTDRRDMEKVAMELARPQGEAVAATSAARLDAGYGLAGAGGWGEWSSKDRVGSLGLATSGELGESVPTLGGAVPPMLLIAHLSPLVCARPV